ncbi:MAG TPA: hypothetical protein VFF17_14320 [Thermoanaerobaculia bacterium]|nr:hypothetical protein [Thermoanaerobaculia bacterium]
MPAAVPLRRVFALVLAALVLGPTARGDDSATKKDPLAETVERMLAAIGGRTAWASLTNTINDSQQNRLEEPTVVRAVITMDFTRPRFRIETTAPGLRVVRVIDGPRNWRLTRQGTIEDVPAELVLEDQKWYAGHVYRTLHRIAARDAALRLAIGPKGRLEVYESDARIAWFALDARGVPYAYGPHADDTGSIFGPWDFIRDGIRHPAWVSSPDGSWRAAIKSLTINARLKDSTFARPATSKQ